MDYAAMLKASVNETMSVPEIVDAFEKINNVSVPYKFAPRRSGDIVVSYADPSKALKELNWQAKYDLNDMVKSAYNYVLNNKEK